MTGSSIYSFKTRYIQNDTICPLTFCDSLRCTLIFVTKQYDLEPFQPYLPCSHCSTRQLSALIVWIQSVLIVEWAFYKVPLSASVTILNTLPINTPSRLPYAYGLIKRTRVVRHSEQYSCKNFRPLPLSRQLFLLFGVNQLRNRLVHILIFFSGWSSILLSCKFTSATRYEQSGWYILVLNLYLRWDF